MIGEDFFNRKAEIVARDLLGKILVRKLDNKELKARIIETEAYYDEKDPASRACQNGDLKETMKMEAGTVLVYGIHNNWLINFVTNRKGRAEAVLLRALEPLNFLGNCKGPGLLTRALEIDKSFHKNRLGNGLWLEEGEKVDIVSSKRVGVRKDLEKNLRFFIKNNKFVSR
jgi:DNA-3-methyladenine glycosylase